MAKLDGEYVDLAKEKPMHPIKKMFMVFMVMVVLALSSGLLWLSNHNWTAITMYHRVADDVQGRSDTVSRETFLAQMSYLAGKKFKVLSLDEYINAITHGHALSRKTVVLTFDDGTVDNYTNAFPILKQFRLPATIFIPADYIGKEGYLSRAQILEMKKSGLITFGSHGRSHRYLPDLSVEEQRDEIEGSKRYLENLLGDQVDFFAYPSGGFSERIMKLTRKAGYKAGLATNRGFDHSNFDLFQLNRIKMTDSANKKIFMWMYFSGYGYVFKSLKHPY